MIRIAITGGKGGTGKSFVATNLAVLLSSKLKESKLVLADLDVEAPNDYILLGLKDPGKSMDIDIYFPKIDYKKCTSCGACAKVCDTGAIIASTGRPPFVFPRLCSGCKACYYACPYDAIARDSRRLLGYIYVSQVDKGGGFTIVTGSIREGEEHTPPAIVATKRYAESLSPDILITDTGAGTGNGISAAIQYSDLVISVTEPTPLGLHDLESILKVVRGMGYRSWVVVNRSGIGDSNPHKHLAYKYGVEKIFEIPYSRTVVDSYVEGSPIVEKYPSDPVSLSLSRIADEILETIHVETSSR